MGIWERTDVAEVVYERDTNNIKELWGHGSCSHYYDATGDTQSLIYTENSTADSVERHVI